MDPLERLFPGSTYTFGGSQRYITSIANAIQAFIDREYPDVGGKGLKIVPDLPRPQDGITWEDVSKHCVAERHGGLVQGNCLYGTFSVFISSVILLPAPLQMVAVTIHWMGWGNSIKHC